MTIRGGSRGEEAQGVGDGGIGTAGGGGDGDDRATLEHGQTARAETQVQGAVEPKEPVDVGGSRGPTAGGTIVAEVNQTRRTREIDAVGCGRAEVEATKNSFRRG